MTGVIRSDETRCGQRRREYIGPRDWVEEQIAAGIAAYHPAGYGTLSRIETPADLPPGYVLGIVEHATSCE